MRLIIDIPEKVYRASQIMEVKHEDTIQIPLEVIANGIPLDKITDEIQSDREFYKNYEDDINRGVTCGLKRALATIDKYTKGAGE